MRGFGGDDMGKSPVNQGRRYFGPASIGLFWTTLIPLFALIYYLLPDSFDGSQNFLTCLYFSVVTITTLGYGDIVPASSEAQFVSAVQAISGIVIIGLFLNSVAHDWSERLVRAERDLQDNLYRKRNLAALRAFDSLLGMKVVRHTFLVASLFSDQEPPIFVEGNYSEKKFRRWIESEVKVSDMKGIFQSSVLLDDDPTMSQIEAFYESDKEISRLVEKLMIEVDMAIFPKLLELCEKYMRDEKRLDQSRVLCAISKNRFGKNPLTVSFAKMISEWDGPPKLRRSNALNSVMILYSSVRFRTPILLDVMQEINSVLKG